jgi:uncharacterized protein involved in exopolysaccharide biosynthesis
MQPWMTAYCPATSALKLPQARQSLSLEKITNVFRKYRKWAIMVTAMAFFWTF